MSPVDTHFTFQTKERNEGHWKKLKFRGLKGKEKCLDATVRKLVGSKFQQMTAIET